MSDNERLQDFLSKDRNLEPADGFNPTEGKLCKYRLVSDRKNYHGWISYHRLENGALRGSAGNHKIGVSEAIFIRPEGSNEQASSYIAGQGVWTPAPAEFYRDANREIDPQHPYIKAKGLNPALMQDVRQVGDLLLIPLFKGGKGTDPVAVLSIDREGTKKYLRGSSPTGAYHMITPDDLDDLKGGRIYVCEGYATAHSVMVLTGHRSIFVSGSGNLPTACIVIVNQDREIEIVIACDHDEAGIRSALDAIKELATVGARLPRYALPPVYRTDWNDWKLANPEADVHEALLNPNPVRGLVDKANGGEFDDAILQAAGGDPVKIEAAKRTVQYIHKAAADAIEASAQIPTLVPLSTYWDAKTPDAILWRDRGDNMDAVGTSGTLLSVGEVALLSSAGGLGKSTVTLSMAIAGALAKTDGTQSEPACGLRVCAGDVVLINYEDAPERIGRRLRSQAMVLMQANMKVDNQRKTNNAIQMGQMICKQIHTLEPTIPLFTIIDEPGDARPCRHWNSIWQNIEKVQPKLIIIDPATAALSGVSINESTPVRAFIIELMAKAKAIGAGVLIVCHDTKASRNEVRIGAEPGAGAVAGSATWFDAARGVLILSRDPTDDRRLLLECTKSNYSESGWGAHLEAVNSDGDLWTSGVGTFIGYRCPDGGQLDRVGIRKLRDGWKPKPKGNGNRRDRKEDEKTISVFNEDGTTRQISKKALT